MAAAYRLGSLPSSVQRTADGVWIPNDTRNRDRQTYQAWLTAGGVPDPYVVPPQPPQPLSVPGTGQLFSGNGSIISRIADRMFIGEATANDGAFPNVAKDWLATYQSYYNGVSPTVTTNVNILSIGQPFLAAARTAGGPNSGQNALGIQGYAIANNANGGDYAWGLYCEGHACTPTSSAWGAEIHAVNRTGAIHPLTPYHTELGTTISLQLSTACGFPAAQMGAPAMKSTSAGLVFTTGAQTDTDQGFLSGIVFTNTCLATSEAIAFAQPHRMNWYAQTSPMTPIASIGCSLNGVQLYSKGVAAIEAHVPVTGETGLLLAVNRAGTTVLSQVKLGAVNSGGTGLRALVVDN